LYTLVTMKKSKKNTRCNYIPSISHRIYQDKELILMCQKEIIRARININKEKVLK